MSTLRTLTIVKTDVRQFTDRVERMTSGELDAFLRAHRADVARVFSAHGGRIVKEIGDSYLAAFESSTAALEACIELQRHLVCATENPSAGRIEVRIAVTSGDVLEQEGDVFGTPVN